MERVLDWATAHQVEILITDLPDEAGARYYKSARQLEIAYDVTPERRLELLLEIVKLAESQCAACKAGIPHTGGRRVAPIGCIPSTSCDCPLAVGV